VKAIVNSTRADIVVESALVSVKWPKLNESGEVPRSPGRVV
jgi:hypothetical protein